MATHLLVDAFCTPLFFDAGSKWLGRHAAKPVVGDWVQFRKSGDADLGDDKGVYLTCPYRLDGSTVVLNCTVRGKQKQLALTTIRRL